MSIIIIPKNHICFTASQDVSEICRTLFQKYPINYFDWGRIYGDGSFFTLTSKGEFLVHHHEKGYKFLPTIKLQDLELLPIFMIRQIFI